MRNLVYKNQKTQNHEENLSYPYLQYKEITTANNLVLNCRTFIWKSFILTKIYHFGFVTYISYFFMLINIICNTTFIAYGYFNLQIYHNLFNQSLQCWLCRLYFHLFCYYQQGTGQYSFFKQNLLSYDLFLDLEMKHTLGLCLIRKIIIV